MRSSEAPARTRPLPPQAIDVDAGIEAELRAHAESALPEESCGIVIGVRADDALVVTRVMACPNVAPASERARRFEIDPAVVIRTRRELRERARTMDAPESIVGFYHSHPNGESALSETDLRYARNWPGTVWLVVACGAGPDSVSFDDRTRTAAWWLDAPDTAPRPLPLVPRHTLRGAKG